MRKEIVDKINGYGVLLRFITPLLLGIILALHTYMLNDVQDIKRNITNHINHDFISVMERLATIETQLDMLMKNK